MNCVVDLDNDKTTSLDSFKIVDDIFNVCRNASISFFTSERISFDEESFIVFNGSKYHQATVKETYGNGRWHYVVTCVPHIAFQKVNKTITSTQDLADFAGISLSDNSKSMDVVSNLINMDFMNTCSRLRNQSIKMNWNDLKNAFLIYFDSETMVCRSLDEIVDGNNFEYGFSEMMDTITFIDNEEEVKHNADSILPDSITSTSWLKTKFKKYIIIRSNNCAKLFSTYTIPIGNSDKKYLCYKIESDSALAPQFYANYLAEVIL